MSTIFVDNLKGRGETGNTITIPSGNKLVAPAGGLSAPGTVVQCQNVYVTERSSQSIVRNQTAASATNISGMTLNVTPKFANSKMIIQGRWCGEFSSIASAGWNNMFVIQRDNTPVSLGTREGDRNLGHMPAALSYYVADNSSTMESVMWDTVDFPNTTSQVTYTAAIYSGWATSYTLYNNRNVSNSTSSGYEQGTCSVVVWEIAQ
tara:strand:+ start:2949 stop:3566 length:618 start_codon:yes stop_codon:yes gene_type:complete